MRRELERIELQDAFGVPEREQARRALKDFAASVSGTASVEASP